LDHARQCDPIVRSLEIVMDEGTIAGLAIAAATLIGNKLADAGAGQAAESLWAGVTRIYAAVRARLHRDPEGQKALERLHAEPQDSGRMRELAEALQARMNEDPAFAQQVRSLVKQAQEDPRIAAMVTMVGANARAERITSKMELGGGGGQAPGAGGGGGGAFGPGARGGDGGPGGNVSGG
jgi:hypothetical protein